MDISNRENLELTAAGVVIQVKNSSINEKHTKGFTANECLKVILNSLFLYAIKSFKELCQFSVLSLLFYDPRVTVLLTLVSLQPYMAMDILIHKMQIQNDMSSIDSENKKSTRQKRIEAHFIKKKI